MLLPRGRLHRGRRQPSAAPQHRQQVRRRPRPAFLACNPQVIRQSEAPPKFIILNTKLIIFNIKFVIFNTNSDMQRSFLNAS